MWHLESLSKQILPAGLEIDYIHYDDNDNADSSELLEQFGGEVLRATGVDDKGVYAVTSETHLWDETGFERLAKMKQTLLNKAHREGYAFVFLCDSDLVLDPYTLASLLSTQQDIVNGVFWTRWNPQAPPQPQCWLSHPYGLAGMGVEESTYLKRLVDRELVQVAGGGACTLISYQALAKGVGYHPRLPGLPEGGMWQGEDRSFALRAQRLHIPQYADAWPNIFHAYHPNQRTAEVLEGVYEQLLPIKQSEQVSMEDSDGSRLGSGDRPQYGDLINFYIYPLDNQAQRQAIPEHLKTFRGRLGGIQMLPEMEAAILQMTRGEERSLRITYPPWWPVEQLRGQSCHMLIELVDFKPYGMAPVVAEVGFSELLG